MAGFSELIKNFSKTREYVHDFFVYGFKVRGEFNKKSSRTYDDEKRRTESWMCDHIRYDELGRGRQVSISVDCGHIQENPLYSAFRSCSFTDNDIKLHFLITDMLCGGEELSLREMTDRLNTDYGFLFDEQTVRNKLKEYVQEGIVISVKKGKTMYYRLSEDRTEDYFRGFPGLEDAVKFFSETRDIGVIGNSMLRQADLKNDIFYMKHNYIIHTLEDILIPDILEAMNDKCFLIIKTFSSETNIEKVVPMQILASLQTGRRYLAAYIPGRNRFTSRRLDKISDVKNGGRCEDYDLYKEKYDKNISKCFGVSFGNRHTSGTVSPMKISFYVDEEKESFILDRIERERRCAVLEKTGEHIYTLTADVFDPNEFMHWAKTFIGRIVNVEGGSDEVRMRYISDIIKMKKMYGGDDDEDIQ